MSPESLAGHLLAARAKKTPTLVRVTSSETNSESLWYLFHTGTP
jgi:hypothetical protein